MGVGLSISQTIIEAHGGKLIYQKGKSSGSIFTFTLPANGGKTLPHIEK